MNPETLVMSAEEQIQLRLRSLYQQYGYAQYRMNKFEEYDLYAGNKDFLISENVLTFTDLNGRLMALKPDVTLSIVRFTGDRADAVQKLYYNENVYRTAGTDRSFREIPQTGLECIGPLDGYCVLEVLTLAAESLKCISRRSVLELSHLDIIAALVGALGVPAETQKQIIRCIGGKNLHELQSLCRASGAGEGETEALERLVSASGKPGEVLPLLRVLPCPAEAVAELEKLVEGFEAAGLGEMLRLDFSVINDMQYYNGIVFRGYVEGVPTGVLSGGRYDRLMEKMGRSSGAIGFAVYLDELDRIVPRTDSTDADVLLLYDDSADSTALCREMRLLAARGRRVLAQRTVPQGMRFGEIRHFREKEAGTC